MSELLDRHELVLSAARPAGRDDRSWSHELAVGRAGGVGETLPTEPSFEARRQERYQASLKADDRYRLLVEGITDYAIYLLSPDGTVTSWNRGAEIFKGYNADEIIGRHFSDFYTPEDRAAGLPARALETAAREGKFESEGWRVRKDGGRFWAYVVIDPIRGTGGELVGFAKITRDLTERRAAEEALRISQEQFRLLVQGVTDYAIYMLTPAGEIASWNAGAERIKGYSSDEVLGTHFSRFYTADDKAAGEPARALAVAAKEGRFEKEGQRVRKDGSTFWANIVIDALRASDGALIGFAKITRDVTAQRESRKALEEAREKLFQAQKMDAIGQLTGGVAHDFNNLLMVIKGSLELLCKRIQQDPRAVHLLENAQQGTSRGIALTQRMLAFARRQELKVSSVDIPALVAGMTELLTRSLDSKVEMELHFPLKLAAVLADANQLELALLNLVVNARDAMPLGGTIVIAAKEARLEDAPLVGRYVCLSVMDSGEGMDAQTLARAAEPFFTTKGVGKGTGLGLPMVHGVAQQSGGRLVLKSDKGRGTTAEIWLPCAPKTAAEAPLPSVSKVEASVGPRVVMLVDDDALVLQSAAAMLEDLGHRVIGAASGKQALSLLAEHPEVEVLITDHAMPIMTGVELVEAVKRIYPSLPVVLATGYAELPADLAPDLTRLAKPFTQRELENAMSQAAIPDADSD
jgi:PAS domain S-box-containing protein